MIGAADLASGEIGGTADLTVCFADLVEFTRLGEEIAARGAGLGRRPLRGDGERRRRAAGAAGEDDRRRGDARLQPSPSRCSRAALALIDAAEAEGEEFPWLRAGLACGPTLPQSGDYYGRAVNLASRITGVARPGSVLVDAATKEAAGEGFDYSYAGERRLKGIDTG